MKVLKQTKESSVLYGIGMMVTFIGFALFLLSGYSNDLNNSQKYGLEEPLIRPSILLLITYGFAGSLLWPLTLVLFLFNKDKILKSFGQSELEAKNFAQVKALIEEFKKEEIKKEVKKEIKDERRREKKNKEKKNLVKATLEPSRLISPEIVVNSINWDDYNEELDKAIEYINHKAKHPENIAWGLKQITRLAEMGMPKAQYKLGLLYYTGEGVEPDIDKYFFWMGKCESVYGSAKNPKFMK